MPQCNQFNTSMYHCPLTFLGARKNWGETVEHVTLLTQRESVRVDTGRLEELYRHLGEAGAEDVVCRALEDLAARLADIERCYRSGEAADMRRYARSLATISEPIGLQSLARVAGDVIICIDYGDPVALAATLARLLRIGESSLTDIWDVAEMPV